MQTSRSRQSHFEQLEPRELLSATNPPIANDDFLAVANSSSDNLFDPLVNDRLAPDETGSLSLLSVMPARHGAVTLDTSAGTLRYTPAVGYEGDDELNYLVGDTLGGETWGTVHVRVGLTAFDPTELAAFEPANDPDSTNAWLTQLETGTGDITVPDGGVVIARSITIANSRRILGHGQSIKFVGDGMIHVNLSANDTFEFRDATVVWERNLDEPGALYAFDLHSGRIVMENNTFHAAVVPRSGAYSDIISLRETVPSAFLVRAGDADGTPTELRIEKNTFNNAYWYGCGVVLSNSGQPLASASFSENSISYFHSPLVISGWNNGAVVHNTFDRSTFDNLAISSSDGIQVERNEFRFPAGGPHIAAIRMMDLTGANVTKNVIMNSEGSGIVLSGVVRETTVDQNFIHASAGSAVMLGAGDTFSCLTNISLFDNFLVQNNGWAIEARNVTGLSLQENVFQQNHAELDFQHHFDNVSGIVEQGNLWDVDFTTAEMEDRKMFGTNVLPYTFSQGMLRNEQESAATPLDTDLVATFEPTGTQQDYDRWMRKLETGHGDIQIPAAGVIINRAITIQKQRRIVGNGNTLKFVGDGQLRIDIPDEEATFGICNARIVWERQLSSPGATDALQILRGGMEFQDNQVYALVQPSTYTDDDVSLGTVINRDILSQSTSQAWFFHFDSTSSTSSELTLERNTFQSARWYSVGLLYTNETAHFSTATIRDNTVKYFHGAFFLNGIDNGIVETNRLHRNSFGNVVISHSANIVVHDNRIEFAGNGTSGDGSSLRQLSGAVVSDNFILNASCYGIWLLEDIDNSTLRDNVIHGGITSAIRFESVAGLRTFDNILVNDNLLSHNLGWGLSGQGAQSIQVTNNVFQGNITDEWGNQHHFSDVESVTADGNLLGEALTAEQTSRGERFGVQVSPYHILSNGQDVLVDGSSIVVRGTSSDDVFQVLPGTRVEFFVNGDWRSFDPSVIHSLKFDGGGGRDATLIWTDALVRSVTLGDGMARVEEASYAIETDTADVSIFGDAPVLVVAIGTADSDYLYASPNYIHLYSESYDKYVTGFGGSITYAMGDGDVAILDDGLGNDRFIGDAAMSCLIGDGFHHVVEGAAYVLARSDSGDNDSAVVGVTGNEQVGTISGGTVIYDSSFYLQLGGFENVSFDPNDVATIDCYRFDGLLVPTGSIRGHVSEDIDGDGLRSSDEPGLEGRTVFLDENRNGLVDAEERSTISAADGTYEFDSVSVGEHFVAQLAPQDWMNVATSVTAMVKPGWATSGVDLQSHQSVRRENGLVTFSGTNADDDFAFAVVDSQLVVSFNHVDYSFGVDQAAVYRFLGNGGEDHARVDGSGANERVDLRPLGGTMVGSGFEVRVDGAAWVDIRGGGGADIANIVDSSGDDVLTLWGQDAEMHGGDFHGTLQGFAEIYATSDSGDDDRAYLYDSAGNDTFLTMPEYTVLSGPGYHNYLRGFTSVYAYAIAGGNDRADLFDSPGNDELIATPQWSRIAGSTYYRFVQGFDETYAFATAGGNDVADLYDSAGNDELVATPDFGRLSGDQFYLMTTGFETLNVRATSGGQDNAYLFDSTGNDEFVATPEFNRLFGEDFYVLAEGFDSVSAYATSGGDDNAYLFDSAGDDELVATPQFNRILGSTFYNYAEGFEHVEAYANQGGNDRAFLYDSAGDDELVSTPQFSRMVGASFYNYAAGFDRVDAYATAGGVDRAYLFDSAGDDDLLATVDVKRLMGQDFFNVARGFESTFTYANAGGSDTANIRDVRSIDILYGRAGHISRTGPGIADWIDGFDFVTAEAQAGDTATADVKDVTFFFQQLGNWT